jgi:hypothetical protein
MNFKIAFSLLLTLSVNGSFALRGLQDGSGGRSGVPGGGSAAGGARGDGTGGGGPPTSTSKGSGGPGDRPFGMPNGGRPAFPGIEPEFTDITCAADYNCSLPRNGDDAAGVFVCRQLFHPITGESSARAMCIPSDRAWESDECGCCGEDCPEQPEFVDITCDDEGEDVDEVIVCRELTNPFTGQLEPTTIHIPGNRGLDGDACGCCNDVCPERGDQRFPRPDALNITCEAPELITCDLPSRKDGEDEENEGLFVCRTMFNPNTGESEQQPLCVPSDRAWSTDECGCCGEDCPVRPAPVEIQCEEEQLCELRNGEEGVFVCRGLYHPISGELAERSMCIPSDRAWVTDTCGCCESGCPELPKGGFDSEDAQLVSFALEASELADNTVGSGAGGAPLCIGIMMMNIFVGTLALLI